jgi:rare lipoprotein A
MRQSARSLHIYACLLSGALLGACGTVPYEPPAQRPTSPPASRPTPVAPIAAPSVEAAPQTSQPPASKGGGYYLDDGPGNSVPPNLADIPDAIPRVEALHPPAKRPYVVMGNSFTPLQQVQPFTQTGIGSWYGKKFHGAKTSNGERYDMFAMTAAHPTLPLPSYARVTNLANGRSVVVRINDRGPFLHKRIIDLSYAAAWKLGYVNQGSAKLQVDAIVPDDLDSLIASKAALLEAPTTAPTIEPTSAATTLGIFLQLGAFSSSANAENYRNNVQNELQWLQHGLSTQLIGDKYRLHVGPFRDADEARSVAERIASALRVQPFIVTR